MKVERIAREIEFFINEKLGNKFVLEIDIVLDEAFRCISVTNKSEEVISEEEIVSFMAIFYVEFGTYVSETINVLSGEMFNIYLHDDQYIRTRKINKLITKFN